MTAGICYCPLHSSAEALRDALDAMHEAFKWTSHNSDEDRANEWAKRALAQAEGKPSVQSTEPGRFERIYARAEGKGEKR